MSVLIHDMEMPQSCDDCRLNNGISCYAVPEYTEDGVVGRTEDRPDWCPLVPVPPHGRLIDADALVVHKFDGAKHDISIEDGGACYCRGWNDAIEAIMENAKTIIGGE